MSIFAFDVGNTNVTAGLFVREKLVHVFRFASDARRTADEWVVLFTHALARVGHLTEEVEGVVLGSVVPPLTSSLREAARVLFDVDPLILGPGVRTGIPIRIDNPRELGADRLANAVGARERYGAPAIVVDFGTATTFDVIGADGAYEGGVIAPGVEIGMEALFARTAKLPKVALEPPPSPLGKNTVDALQAGLFYGTLGQVEGILRNLKALLPSSTRVIATGGLGEPFARASREIDLYDPELTLYGLWTVYRKNRMHDG
ncbi:type III pantothenate kinase [Brockia lithotrophica]|uniref:Type III pantothenate kinase n=1 Tax=Brockia lithotrophica TaxID=933949 RepID=A0A660KZ36_9BACL|nr:type III pantothenate kinase [Brockia lithotrophica]RKQ85617.1 pantothenate kinase [Brockia lithotrophica]